MSSASNGQRSSLVGSMSSDRPAYVPDPTGCSAHALMGRAQAAPADRDHAKITVASRISYPDVTRNLLRIWSVIRRRRALPSKTLGNASDAEHFDARAIGLGFSD